MNDQELLEALEQSHQRNKLDAAFADTLEARLRAAHRQNRRRSLPLFYRSVAGFRRRDPQLFQTCRGSYRQPL